MKKYNTKEKILFIISIMIISGIFGYIYTFNYHHNCMIEIHLLYHSSLQSLKEPLKLYN